MCAKFGCGPTVVSKKRGVQTDRQTDKGTLQLYIVDSICNWGKSYMQCHFPCTPLSIHTQHDCRTFHSYLVVPVNNFKHPLILTMLLRQWQFGKYNVSVFPLTMYSHNFVVSVTKIYCWALAILGDWQLSQITVYPRCGSSYLYLSIMTSTLWTYSPSLFYRSHQQRRWISSYVEQCSSLGV